MIREFPVEIVRVIKESHSFACVSIESDWLCDCVSGSLIILYKIEYSRSNADSSNDK